VQVFGRCHCSTKKKKKKKKKKVALSIPVIMAIPNPNPTTTTIQPRTNNQPNQPPAPDFVLLSLPCSQIAFSVTPAAPPQSMVDREVTTEVIINVISGTPPAPSNQV